MNSYLKRLFYASARRVALAITQLCLLLGPMPDGAAQPPAQVSGRVINGTTDTPVANFELYLMAPGAQGLQTVKTLRTDAEGKFSLSGVPDLMQSPHVLQAEYRGVNYNHMIRPMGKLTDIELAIFETTPSLDGIKISLPHMMIRREGDLLRVDEVYQVENPTRKSFVSQDGFQFYLPKNITKLGAVSVMMPGSSMPIAQSANEVGDGETYNITNAMKPGRTQIQISYEMSYAGSRASLPRKFFYPLEVFNLFLSPEDIQVTSNLLKDATTESTGFRTLAATAVPAKTEVAIDLTGGSSRPPDAPPGTAPTAGSGMGATAPPESRGQVVLVPPALERYRVLILVNVAILLAAFVGWRLTSRDATESQAAQQLKKGGSKGKLLKQRETLLDQIALLDEQFEAQTIADADYRKKRPVLKNQLRDVTFALESAAADSTNPAQPKP